MVKEGRRERRVLAREQVFMRNSVCMALYGNVKVIKLYPPVLCDLVLNTYALIL